MNENLNLGEILKDCPKGTKLYSPIFGEVEFNCIYKDISERGTIECESEDGVWYFNIDGTITIGNVKSQIITLYPSKDQQDWSKFKIKSNKPKFDPKTLQPFDKVLVKRGDKSYHVWFPDFISLPPNDIDETALCMTTDDVVMVIPYNDETKHLAGTNKEAPEFYRYWED